MRAGHCSWRGVGNGTHTEASFRRPGLRDMLEHWTRPMRACNAHAARELVRNAEHAGWDGIDRMGAKRLAAEESFSCGVGGRFSRASKVSGMSAFPEGHRVFTMASGSQVPPRKSFPYAQHEGSETDFLGGSSSRTPTKTPCRACASRTTERASRRS